MPSISQMNGAFLQAVTMSKAERHAHFNQAGFFGRDSWPKSSVEALRCL